MSKLPEKWAVARLHDIAAIRDSRRIPLNGAEREARIRGKSAEQLFPYYGATGQVGLIDDFLFEGEHVLIGEDGAPFFEPTKEKAYLASGQFWVNNHAHILRAYISNRYLKHFLNHVDYSDYVTGTTRLKLTKSALCNVLVPFAPANEQRRIVAKIDELFSELDKAVESLTTAREQLKAYRQSILKHAFEGKLTADWRATCGSKGDAANHLQMTPVAELLAEPLSNGRSVQDRRGGFPVLRLTAFRNGDVDPTQRKEGDWDRETAAPFILQDGDFLVARGNGSKQLVGIGGLVNKPTDEVAFPDTMIRIRLDTSRVDPNYFSLCWNSRLVRNQIERDARTTAGIYKINQNHISAFTLPTPSLAEQKIIAQRIEEKLSAAFTAITQTDAQILRASSLRQSILAQAFSGQLVGQDPNDEPAAILLERIRAEKQKPAVPEPQKRAKGATA